MKRILFLALFLLHLACNGQGTTSIWNEAINGQISNDVNSPTSLGTLPIGNNIIAGTTEFYPSGGGGNGVVYRDFFTIVIAPGTTVPNLPFWTDKPVGIWLGDETFQSLLAYAYDPSPGDLLTKWGLTSLDAGTYGIFIGNQDQLATDTSLANYSFEFNVTAVPEPSTIALGAIGVAAVFFLRRRGK